MPSEPSGRRIASSRTVIQLFRYTSRELMRWMGSTCPVCRATVYPRRVGLVIARCQVDYSGCLTSHLPMATRLLLVKSDGSVSIHSDDRAYKPFYPWLRQLSLSPRCLRRAVPGSVTRATVAEGWRR